MNNAVRPTLNVHSLRAVQARLGVLLKPKWLRLSLVGLFAIAQVAGIGTLISGQPLGWFLLGLSFLPVMSLVWYEWWLKDIPVARNPQTIDDVLESDLLGRLPNNVSPSDMAEIVMRTYGGLFFAARMGLGPSFVRDLSSVNPADTGEVWQTAHKMANDLHVQHISAAAVTASLLNVFPYKDKMLAHMQLTSDDITAGVRWYHHLQDLIRTHLQYDAGGGVGRDLSFGYTNLLSRFTTNVSEYVAGGNFAREVDSHQQLLSKICEQLVSTGSHSSVLVGPSGVGKTAVVHALAARLMQQDSQVPSGLRYHQVLALDPSSLISQAGGRGELEALLDRLLGEAQEAKNVILFLDNAELFFGEATGAVDMRNILLPALESGALDIIMAIDEHEWLKLMRSTPALAQRLNRITVQPLNEAETLMVCEDQILTYEFRFKVTYMYQALKAAYKLGSRYVSDQAMPGQALRMLEAAAHYDESGRVTMASVEQAAEQLYGVKVSTARKGDERQILLNLEKLIHERMINQTRAVTAVANAMRRARSGVRNQNRPIGSFLFLGPTGVGKTELAKALAAVYFGGEDHMVRVDLNEFGAEGDVARLIADATTDPNSLTAQIAKRPFSVVLFDEIEKAHPTVQDTLLQLIDEGVLRDINNRAISFRDAVIIATSNAGADKIRAYIDVGKQPDEFEEEFVNELIDSGKFKPEFLNRFDEATVFRPLTEDELLQVVDIILKQVNKTLAEQQIQVQVGEEAKRVLVREGNDPRLGARPLRRVVQRTVENIVAKQVLLQQVAPGGTIEISLAEIEEELQK